METLNEMGRLWAAFFGPAVVQNTLFLCLVFLVLHWLRNAPASLRYAVAAVGLVKLLLPPFIPSYLVVPAAAPSLQFPTSTLFFSFNHPPLGTTVPVVGSSIGLDVFGALFWIWAGAALIIFTRSIIMTARLAAAVKDAVPVEDTGVAGPLGDRRIEVYRSDRIGMPLTIGLFPRRIFVPTAWDTWSPDWRKAVVRHELAHISRRDGLFQALEIAVQALYFFHPLVLILNQRLREYREMACDDASVGRERNSRLGYSKFLLDLAETATRPPVVCDSASALIRRKNELFKRVAYQVKEGNMLPMSKMKMAVLLTVVIVAVVPLSLQLSNTYHPDQAVAKSKSAKSSTDVQYVDVAVKGDVILIDGNKTSLEHFSKAMNKMTNGKTDHTVVKFDCDGDVSMASLFEVQKQMLDLGLYKVSYADGAGFDVPVVLPNEHLEKKMQSIPPENIANVTIKSSGKVLFNKMKVNGEKLRQVVEKSIKDNPKLIVSVHMDGETRYQDFVAVLGQIKKGGADKVFINKPMS
jgi:beta-lactamase regulating signal transducer with metallopeptidase domain